jgi:hypothetical protein
LFSAQLFLRAIQNSASGIGVKRLLDKRASGPQFKMKKSRGD